MTDLPFDKCPAGIRKQIESAPAAPANLILRVSEVGDSQRSEIRNAGFEIQREMSLVPTFVVNGPVSSLSKILEAPWLLRVEADREIGAF